MLLQVLSLGAGGDLRKPESDWGKRRGLVHFAALVLGRGKKNEPRQGKTCMFFSGSYIRKPQNSPVTSTLRAPQRRASAAEERGGHPASPRSSAVLRKLAFYSIIQTIQVYF